MRWSAADIRGTAASLTPWWSLLTAEVPAEVAAAAAPPALLQLLQRAETVTTPAQAEGALADLSVAARRLATWGYGMTTATGSVAALFLSDGGVPKRAVSRVEVDPTGIAGDRQRTRKHHGRVWQALCLWSAEVVADLQAEGHPVFPGACGENMLVTGVDWGALRPGARLRIGEVLAEITLPTVPCKQIRPFFTSAAVRRVDHDRHPGSSRWYASVVEAGVVKAGDAVVVEPSQAEAVARRV
jgi:MOSC domain-containing protein YiiM